MENTKIAHSQDILGGCNGVSNCPRCNGKMIELSEDEDYLRCKCSPDEYYNKHCKKWVSRGFTLAELKARNGY